MSLVKAMARRSLLLVSALAPLCFGLLIGAGDPSKLQSSSTDDIKVINKTTTLEAVSLKRTEHNHLILLLKNVSAKNLNGFALTLNGGIVMDDISSGDRFISPGQTTDLEIPLDSPLSEITILAAMYTDGSIEGDPVTSGELKEWRLGIKKQLIRGLSILNAILNSSDITSAAILDELQSKFSVIEVETDNATPQFTSGTQDAKNSLNGEIQDLRDRRQRNGSTKQRQRLLNLKSRIERRIASL
jgi:hypothetical protein